MRNDLAGIATQIRRRVGRRKAPLAVGMAVLATAPMLAATTTPASAATAARVERQGLSVVYDGGAGQANVTRFSIENGQLAVLESGAALSVGDGCRIVEPGKALCGFGVTSIAANLGDGSDIGVVSAPLAGVVRGGSGDDTFFGSLSGAASRISYEGEGGAHDKVVYAGSSSAVDVSLDGFANDGRRGLDGDNIRNGTEDVVGGSFSDTIVGDGGRNTLSGGLGNDTVDGRAGDDVLAEDSAANGADTLLGGSGSDVLQYLFRTRPVTVNLNALRDDGETGEKDFVQVDIELIHGGSAGDTMNGDGRPQTFNGGAGEDYLFGAGGSDGVIGGPGRDFLFGGSGDDSLHAFDKLPAEPGDLVDCGSDSDRATVDRTDDLVGCETVG